MPHPFILVCLTLATFALAYMGSTPDIDGPVYVFAMLRAVMTKVGKAIPGGWGGWMVSAATCIVCWSPWCALAVVSIFAPGLPPRELAFTVMTISGAVIALDRWLDRTPVAAVKAPCKDCGAKAATTHTDRPTTTKKADAQAAPPAPMPKTLTGPLTKSGGCKSCGKKSIPAPAPATDEPSIVTTETGRGWSAGVEAEGE